MIVMTTKCVELGRHKCTQYWPDEGVVQYGNVTVTVAKLQQFDGYDLRTIKTTCRVREKEGRVRVRERKGRVREKEREGRMREREREREGRVRGREGRMREREGEELISLIFVLLIVLRVAFLLSLFCLPLSPLLYFHCHPILSPLTANIHFLSLHTHHVNTGSGEDNKTLSILGLAGLRRPDQRIACGRPYLRCQRGSVESSQRKQELIFLRPEDHCPLQCRRRAQWSVLRHQQLYGGV